MESELEGTSPSEAAAAAAPDAPNTPHVSALQELAHSGLHSFASIGLSIMRDSSMLRWFETQFSSDFSKLLAEADGESGQAKLMLYCCEELSLEERRERLRTLEGKENNNKVDSSRDLNLTRDLSLFREEHCPDIVKRPSSLGDHGATYAAYSFTHSNGNTSTTSSCCWPGSCADHVYAIFHSPMGDTDIGRNVNESIRHLRGCFTTEQIHQAVLVQHLARPRGTPPLHHRQQLPLQGHPPLLNFSEKGVVQCMYNTYKTYTRTTMLTSVPSVQVVVARDD